MLPKLTPKDVLLAEDDLDDLFHFELALKEVMIPFVLRHAKDGEVLFQKLKEAIPDILFLDIHMPCKNGMTCILEIRSNPQYNSMPVVMITSYAHRSYVNQAYSGGANYYVVKQNDVKALADKLRLIFSIEWDKQLYFPPKNEFLLA